MGIGDKLGDAAKKARETGGNLIGVPVTPTADAKEEEPDSTQTQSEDDTDKE
ncbi:hypothetical protein [Streptomyces sp. NPDC055506]